MAQKKKIWEAVIHGMFLVLGLITVGCVLLITVYLVISGIPAIRKIGLGAFLTGKVWESTAAQPHYGILPFILTSVYGTAGAIVLGVPIGFLTAVYLSKVAPKGVKRALNSAVSLLAGIPSVVYGLVGMLVLVPTIRKTFHLPDGASLLAAILVLAGDDPAVDHQGERHRARRGAEGVRGRLARTGRNADRDLFSRLRSGGEERHRRGGRARRRPRHRRGDGGDDGLRQRVEYAHIDLWKASAFLPRRSQARWPIRVRAASSARRCFPSRLCCIFSSCSSMRR